MGIVKNSKNWMNAQMATKANNAVMGTECALKTVLAVAINTTGLIMTEVMENLAKEKMKDVFRQGVKKSFMQARRSWDSWENRILMGRRNFFDPKLIISDAFSHEMSREEYFEFWKCCGCSGLVKSVDKVNLIRSAFYKCQRGKSHAVERAMVMTLIQMMEIESAMYWQILETYAKMGQMSVKTLDGIFYELNLEPVCRMWRKAMDAWDREWDLTEATGEARREIMEACDLLGEMWADPAFFKGCIEDNVNEFDIFRSRKMQREIQIALREEINDDEKNKAKLL